MSITDLFKNLFSDTKSKPREVVKQHIKQPENVKTQSETSLRKGVIGEFKIEYLIDELPKEYKLLNDVLIANSKSSTGYSQIDHVLITHYGIFVIETKNYQGHIQIKRGQDFWVRDNKHKFYSPLRQNYGHIQALKTLLKNNKIGFYSVISFTGRCTLGFDLEHEIELKKKVTSEIITYDYNLPNSISGKLAILKSENTQPLLNDNEIVAIQNKISEANIQDVELRKQHVDKAKQALEMKKKTQYKCAVCNTVISDKVANFCLANKDKYKGRIYCMKHQ